MIKNNTRIRVVFNDAHVNLPLNTQIPQGGVSRFAQKFEKYFKINHPHIDLISLLFSHNTINKDIYIRETRGVHKYYELVYPRSSLIKTYKKEYTKKEYTKFLEPWISKIEEILKKVQPNIVFLNGFSLSNWIIMSASYRQKIPICIQHAGIWKKELITSQKSFSSSIKKIFMDYEKDIFKKTSHQIFLNEFSRDIFFSLHNISNNKKNLSKTSVIPLPINTTNFKKIHISNKKTYNIGVVARWDRIKNHDATLRLAKYIKKNKLPFSISVVTHWDEKHVTDFNSEYKKRIKIIKPMSPDKLLTFYSKQDIILIPSRFDVSPTVLMEALSCGKPVIISSSVGWISDYHKFKLDKLIINPQTSGENIYNSINELISNKTTYINKFNKLQKKIINKHNTKEVFKEYYNIFKTFI